MNYLLVMPKKLSTGASTTDVLFPLGMAYVSAAMKKARYSVVTANLEFNKRTTKSILQDLISEHNIDVVCTGGLSLDYWKIKETIDTAKEIKPEVCTVVGGGIISSDPEPAMRALGADIGVIGEGELTMCELAHAFDNGKSYHTIPGLIFRKGDGSLTKTRPRKEIQDLDTIPFPDFDGFNYHDWLNLSSRVGVLLSDRSCPFRCTFCFHPTGERYRQRSLDNIFQEIEYQIDRYDLTGIAFTSELFATNKKRVYEFCERIKEYNISWSCCLRVTDVDRQLLNNMKKSGCTLICYGLESADDSVLKSMRKGITVAHIKRALDLTSEIGISTDSSNFIFGDINETPETIENTLTFWRTYNKKTHINLCLIQIYPGSYLYEYACQKGIIQDREQFLKDGCPIINVSKLSDAEFHGLKSTIAELRLHPHTPATSIRLLDVHPSGECTIEYICRKCQIPNIIKGWFYFTSKCQCPRCGINNEVDPFLGALYEADLFYSRLPKDNKIALWGAGGVFYKLMSRYEYLSSDRFILVDANTELNGLVLCNKIVNSPISLEKERIETVIITALSRKDEICRILREDYPSVKHILIPSLQLRGKRAIPILIYHDPIETQK